MSSHSFGLIGICLTCPYQQHCFCRNLLNTSTPEFEVHSLKNITLLAKQYLYYQGDMNEGLFVLREGWLILTRHSEDGKRQVVRSILPGELIGFKNTTMNRAEIRSQKRKEVVEAVTLRKEPVEVVARVYNIPLRTVFDWLARYRQGGWHALIEKNRQGRPKKITGDDMKWLYDAITMGNPLNYKLPFCLWSSNNIRALLQKERAVILSKSSICRLLGHLGLTPQKPLYKSYKQDPEKIKVYLSKTYPEVVAQAKKYHARIYFLDEAAFRSDAHRGTTWGKCGETPVIKDSGGRFGFKLISAVSARGDMHFDVIEESMNADKFINFLEKLRQDAGCPIFVIADNARYHHSKKVQAFLETQLGEIMIAFLPAYSPELNPDEQVWNHAKAEVSKYPIKSKLDMEKLILSAMLSIQQKIELVKSFFRLPDTLYTENYSEG